MGFKIHLLFALLFIHAFNFNESFSTRSYARVSINPSTKPLNPSYGINMLNRSSFPKDFVFGAATSAYQVEGAWNESGRGPSIWDTFTHEFPEKMDNRSNGDVAVDSYHRYEEDVAIIRGIGLDAYRFSISWSRVLPNGKLSGGVNEEGIKYYNNLINEILVNGLTPYVTLFHWDLPQALEDEYGGFLNPSIVDDFHDYANLCFIKFGDRVKYWTTLNEPWSYSVGGYVKGEFAPGRCSLGEHVNCTGGDSSIEPYLVSHNQLLAHATAARLYKEKYQASQMGKIGITLVSTWMVPYSNSTLDRHATLRALDFMLGWFMEPLTTGEYPHTMQSLVKNRLPKFSLEQSKMVKGSFDFLGLNYYTAFYVAHMPIPNSVNLSYITDSQANLTDERNGVPIGEQAGSHWLHAYPRGIWDLLLYIKRKYDNPLIYIMENGVDEINNATLSQEAALVDNFRIIYYHRHLSFVHKAIKDGVNLKAYFAWSLLDNFEWKDGYTVRFGINYIDFKDGLKRYPKLSAKWFQNFLNVSQLYS